MTDGKARVELNDRAFILDHELAAALATSNVIHRCLECDPSGNDYHLDPDHTIAELLAAGAEAWSPPQRAMRASVVRMPILLAHHENGGGRG